MFNIAYNDLQRKLARAVLGFQDSYLARDNSPVGLLCQVWMPDTMPTTDGDIELKTKGMPFCVAGMGDLLALFRCISCRFNFSTNTSKPEALGAPGRVFLSGHPELACNVQQYPRHAYLRRAEAAQCHVQSSMLLPVFALPPSIPSSGDSIIITIQEQQRQQQALAVIEVVQTSDDMAFLPVARLLGSVLMKCGLYTSPLEDVQLRLPTAVTRMDLPLRTGLLEGGPHHASSGDGHVTSGARRSHEMIKKVNSTSIDEVEVNDRRVRMYPDKVTEDIEDNSEEENSEGEEEEEEDVDDDDDDEDYNGVSNRRRTKNTQHNNASHRRGRGGSTTSSISAEAAAAATNNNSRPAQTNRRRTGKPGVKLTLADLQGQFGVGIKDAANALGICTTTLKRACRRHGIQRWPRRALAKVSKTLDEMERRGALGTSYPMVGALPLTALLNQTNGQLVLPCSAAQQIVDTQQMPIDFRWATLANMIPTNPMDVSKNINPNGLMVQDVNKTKRPAPSQAAGIDEFAMPLNNTADQQSVGTGLTYWALAGTAAGSKNLVLHQQQSAMMPSPTRPHPPPQTQKIPKEQQNMVEPANNATKSLISPFDFKSTPGEAALNDPSQASLSLPNISSMSIPSFGPSFFLLPGASNPNRPVVETILGAAGTAATAAATTSNTPRRCNGDDIGLLDSIILELMLSEDSRGLVGATDDDLRRFFENPNGLKQQ